MLRIALLSFEHIHAYGYAEVLSQLPNVKFTAFADDNPKRRRAMARRYPKPKVYSSWRRLLDEAPCDAVITASANARHYEMGVEAAKHGKHVLCEKPITTTLEDARALIDTCAEHNVKLQVAFPVRYCAAIQQARQVIASGELGEILAIKTTNHGTMPGGWFANKKLAGGGAIMDHTVHVVDLLRYMLGKEFTQVYAESATKLYPIKVEDCALLMLEMEGGPFVSLDTSWSRPASYKIWGNVVLEFKGTKGNLSLDCFPTTLDIYQNKTMRHTTLSGADDFNRELIAAFVDAIVNDREPDVTGEDGYKALEICMAAYQAIKTTQPVSLPLPIAQNCTGSSRTASTCC
jgi:predicted dehydrogenase